MKFGRKRHWKVGELPGTRTMTWLFYTILYTPIIVLTVFSFNGSRSPTIWSHFSFDWYIKAFDNPTILKAFRNSLIIAFSSSITATSVALLVALAIIRGRRTRFNTPMVGLVLLPLLVPEVVTAVASLSFFSLIGFITGLSKLIIAHTVFCIPFAYLPIWARVSVMDENLEFVAQDLYASPWQAFRRVTLPLAVPGIISGLTLSFIVSLDDFLITFMLADAGTTTLPVYIYGATRLGITPEINAISTVMLSFSVLMVVLYFWLSQLGRKATGGAAPKRGKLAGA